MGKIGVIPARFQVSQLHEGQKKLLETVMLENDKTLIMLGEARVHFTDRNPLPYETREVMLKNYIENFIIEPLDLFHNRFRIIKTPDMKYNEDWSSQLDRLIREDTSEDDDVTLYTGRDGFSKFYSGKYKIVEKDFGINHISGSNHRREIDRDDSRDWRNGVIYATKNKFPISYQAVDIAIIKHETEEILLGRKPAEKKFRFPGGFVDPSDTSLEAAARREAREECGDIELVDYKFVGSFRIDDWRYRNTQDKIMSVLYKCNYLWGQVKGLDDIAEVKWFKLNELGENMLEPEHGKILRPLKEYLEKEKQVEEAKVKFGQAVRGIDVE